MLNATALDESHESEQDYTIEDVYKELRLPHNISDEELVRKVRYIYGESLRYLRQNLYYSEKEVGKAGRFQINTVNDIIRFLQITKTNRGCIYCTIAKKCITIHDTHEDVNSRVKQTLDKTRGVIEKKLIPGLQIESNKEGELKGRVTLGSSEDTLLHIPFTFISREKSQDSMSGKEIRDPKYYAFENLSDFYGGKFLLEKKEHVLPFMNFVSTLIFKRGEFEVKNRSMFSDEELDTVDNVPKEFVERCKNNTFEKKNVSGNLQDIRLVAPLKKDDTLKNLSIEIAFGLEGNENEEGLNAHKIFSFSRKIDERIRLDQYIFPEYITLLAEKCVAGIDNIDFKYKIFEELQKLGFLGSDLSLNSHVKAKINFYLVSGLTEYFIKKSKIIPIRRNGWKHNRVAFSNLRQINIHDFLLPLTEE